MKRLLVLCAALALVPVPAAAQSNNDDFTPLGSRIKRDRQFPTDIVDRWRNETSAVSRSRSRMMMSQFTRCLYKRSKQGSLDLLAITDFGFSTFDQIGLEMQRATRTYGFGDCLNTVAASNNSGVQLRFYPGGLRQWLLQEAYLDRYGDGPSWIRPGYVVGERDFPLSAGRADVRAMLEFADCVVAADPYTADFLFRTSPNSSEEQRAISALNPELGPCLPQGQQISLDSGLLRVLLGEALWHAATNGRAAPGSGQ